MLMLTTAVRDELVAHARRDAPLEACGYLGERDGLVQAIRPLPNVDRSGEHYSLDPQDQFAAVRELRADGLRASVVYHSHPATPARMSAEDLRLAYDPEIAYVIISLAGAAPEIRAFRVSRGEVAEEQVVVQ